MRNIRDRLRQLKDKDLTVLHSEAYDTVYKVSKEFEDGVVTPYRAVQGADAQEVATVARAVGREKKLTGGPESHKLLGKSLNPSPKRVDNRFGAKLRHNRGADE